MSRKLSIGKQVVPPPDEAQHDIKVEIVVNSCLSFIYTRNELYCRKMLYNLEKCVSIYLDMVKTELTKSNFENHFRTLFRLMECIGNETLIDKVSSSDYFNAFKKIQDLYNLSTPSLYYTVIQVRNFLKYCVANNLITKNVDIDNLLRFKVYAKNYQNHFQLNVPEAVYPFDELEMRNFWCRREPNIMNLRNAIIVNLLFDSGIKTGELIAIKRCDINLCLKEIFLSKKKRIIKISELTAELLRSYILRRKDDFEYVFVRQTSLSLYQCSPRSIERIVRVTSKMVSALLIITPGVIRQSYIARQFAQGKNRMEVVHLAGYKHYHVPQLNKFSLRSVNPPDKSAKCNVYRYLEDFLKGSELASNLKIPDKVLDSISDDPDIELKVVSHILLVRESDVIKFLHSLESVYHGFIPIAVRLKEWAVSRDLFEKFQSIYPDKIKNIAHIIHIDDQVTKYGFINSLRLNMYKYAANLKTKRCI